MTPLTSYLQGFATRNKLYLQRTRLAGDVVLILRHEPTPLHPRGQAVLIAVAETEYAAMVRLDRKARETGK